MTTILLTIFFPPNVSAHEWVSVHTGYPSNGLAGIGLTTEQYIKFAFMDFRSNELF